MSTVGVLSVGQNEVPSTFAAGGPSVSAPAGLGYTPYSIPAIGAAATSSNSTDGVTPAAAQGSTWDYLAAQQHLMSAHQQQALGAAHLPFFPADPSALYHHAHQLQQLQQHSYAQAMMQQQQQQQQGDVNMLSGLYSNAASGDTPRVGGGTGSGAGSGGPATSVADTPRSLLHGQLHASQAASSQIPTYPLPIREEPYLYDPTGSNSANGSASSFEPFPSGFPGSLGDPSTSHLFFSSMPQQSSTSTSTTTNSTPLHPIRSMSPADLHAVYTSPASSPSATASPFLGAADSPAPPPKALFTRNGRGKAHSAPALSRTENEDREQARRERKRDQNTAAARKRREKVQAEMSRLESRNEELETEVERLRSRLELYEGPAGSSGGGSKSRKIKDG